MNAADGDETGDINAFWNERDYNKDVANVKASVFATHGLQDDNVRMNHLSKWWAGLEGERRAAQDVADPDRPRGSVRLPPHGVGRHAPPLVRPLAPGRPERDHGRAEGRRRVRREHVDDLQRLAGPGRRPTRTCSCAAPRRRRRQPRAQLGRRHRHAVVDRLGQPEREHDDEQPARLADEPARVPLPHADDDLRLSGTPVIDIEAAVNDPDEPRRDAGRVRPDARRSRGPATASSTRRPADRETCWGESSPDRRRLLPEGHKLTTNVTAGGSRRASSTRPTASRCSPTRRTSARRTASPGRRCRTTTCSRPATRSGSSWSPTTAGTASSTGRRARPWSRWTRRRAR